MTDKFSTLPEANPNRDKPRDPGQKALQYIETASFAGLGTSFKYFTSSQGELQFKTGIFGGESIDAKPKFIQMPSETLYDSQVNAQICIGPYKPRGQISKRMAQGQKGIATIDMVVGRMGSYARSYENDENLDELKKEIAIAEANLQSLSFTDVDDLSDPQSDLLNYNAAFQKYNALKSRLEYTVRTDKSKPVRANNNYKVDSARIVISQKGDVDPDFGIRPGKVGTSRARSFVALKGDDVRIVARESIKLVTGTDNENAQGGKIEVPRGIDLIAANDDQDMQPLVKGTNLLECLDDINDNISSLNGIVMDMLLQQMIFNTAVAFHTHPVLIDPVTLLPGTLPSPVTIGAYAVQTPMVIGTTLFSIISNKINLGRTYIKYLTPKPFRDDSFICSKYNHTN